MLKRKLSKAVIFTTSFVLIAAASGSKSVLTYPGDSILASHKSILHNKGEFPSHAFDSVGLCICLAEMQQYDLADAPRIQLNPQAFKFVKDHLKKNGASLEKVKEISPRFFTMIDTIFRKYNVPVELKYLAVIESRLITTATSRVGAKGLWQFMPSTARLFGLKVNSKYDERKLAYKSTVTAAKYLNYLYGLFDDWLLTIAAYNSGPGYVYAAIRKSGSRNFWALQQYLPDETRKHVKKFISTHYYFEGHGSLTTLTKAETKAHIQAVATYVQKQKDKINATSSDSLEIAIVNANLVVNQ